MITGSPSHPMGSRINMSPYPRSEVFRIRNRFLRRWRSILDNNASSWYKNGDIESVKYVDSLHQSHPPQINMRNVETYPFLEVDAAFTPPIHFLMSSTSGSKEEIKADQPLDASELKVSQTDQPNMRGDDRKRCLESPPPPPPPPPPQPLPAKLKRVQSKRGMNDSTTADAAGNFHRNERNNANFHSGNNRHPPRNQRHVNRYRRRE
ncbi:hypothetical protein TSMEX_005759 [Taenia solium]|eukprot:TsM_001180800 transcript=TsM_001180800 gene=TsM_001180800